MEREGEGEDFGEADLSVFCLLFRKERGGRES